MIAEPQVVQLYANAFRPANSKTALLVTLGLVWYSVPYGVCLCHALRKTYKVIQFTHRAPNSVVAPSACEGSM